MVHIVLTKDKEKKGELYILKNNQLYAIVSVIKHDGWTKLMDTCLRVLANV